MPTDEIVPRAKIAKEINRSTRTVQRYEAERRPGFDKPVIIAGRLYHPRSRIEAFKILGDRLEAQDVVEDLEVGPINSKQPLDTKA